MDPTSWSAYSQHFSRLGASMNHPPGALAQQAQMNDLALSSSLPRQDHIPGYGNAGGPHHFLLAASHGLNPSQANHNDPSFNANLFAANYDASLFSSSFPATNKGHLSSFPQGAAGLFKAVNRENDFNDLRTGFSHCGMSAYARNSDGNNGLSGTSGLGSAGHLFPNSMPPGSWRHSGIIPSSCGPFGVLPHETVLQRSHLVGRGGEKLQGAKQSRSSHPSSSYVEQDLSRGYRSILSSPARPPSSYVDSSNTSHSSLLSPQSDPYFSSVSDNYYSSCSKNDFAAYSSYCSNVQPPGVQRSSISPYCYSQTFGGNFEQEKPVDVPTTSTNTSANPNFTNFVPNNGLNGNPSHLHNGQISRQSVITSNINNNNSSIYNSESHPPNHPYNVREAYPYPPGAAHSSSCLPNHPSNSRGEPNGGRQASIAHMNSNHPNNTHPSTGQNLYPPMSTPIPASTPAHTTPPSSSMGQAYVPTPLPMSHDSGCSVNSQSVMYHSPSNDGCYSTPGTCPSESGSPAKQDLSQHSSPSVYSIESSNLSMNSGQFVDSHHVRPHSSSDVNYNIMNGGLASDNASDSSKVIEENLRGEAGTALMASTQQKDQHLPQVLPIDMVKMNKDSSTYHNAVDARFDNRQANIVIPPLPHIKHADQTGSECSVNTKGDVFQMGTSDRDSPPALDFTAKGKLKCKRGKKRKIDNGPNPLPLNCTYSHLQNNQPSPQTPEDTKSPPSPHSVGEHASPLAAATAASDLPVAVSTSPAPVDLSHSVDLSVKKQDSPPAPPENKESKEPLPDLNYETDKESGGKWSLTKQDTPPENKSKEVNPPKVLEDSKPDVPVVTKNSPKEGSPVCPTPPIDDLSSESKKLCNSIEDDLGFLAGLSSDPDVEDSVSKGSFSEKKAKKEKGFLQSFLTFLESSNEPNVTSDSTPLDEKPEKAKKVTVPPLKAEESEKEDKPAPSESMKSEDDTKDIEESGDKDNFDEAPSLDPSLFGCSTLQKEMVVPNPEAPSFSSDEDENSTQGIFDSVAMAIKRLCEDNEEEHSEKGNKAGSSSKAACSRKDTSAPANEDEDMKDADESRKNDGVEECTIKRACVMRGRRGKRRRTRHLLVIKVKRPAERVASSVPKTGATKAAGPKMRRTKASTKEMQSAKNLAAAQRRPLMRKCKEKGLSRKRTRATKRKTRNCVKRKYAYDETEESSSAVPDVKDSKIAKDVITEKKADTFESSPAAFVPPQPISSVPPSSTGATVPDPVVLAKPVETCETSQPMTPIRPTPPKKKKVNKTIGYRTRKRRRKPRKQSTGSVDVPQQAAAEVSELLPGTATKETPTPTTTSGENPEIPPKPASESCWSTETHFKTGDFVISIDSKDSEKPPIWRIEGKNVLQLFEAQENEVSNSILYRNTSSYSRWSPSSKHKYLKQLVKIIKSDDDTVIVELLKSSENLADKDFSSSCDYTIHPQRENFEVYLQTLVSHALDPDFIPEIIKEKDEYFLSHLQAIEEVTSQKKSVLHPGEKWTAQLSNFITTYPSVNAVASKDENGLCQVCQNCKVQFIAHFQGQPYDPMTLESAPLITNQPASDINFPLCGLCVQTVTLYSRLHHHKYHFFREGCKKVKHVTKGEEKDSHSILEECLQDAKWMTQMFQDMLEMWNACDKYR